MCHGSCATCPAGADDYRSCSTCISSRFSFSGACFCPDDMFEVEDTFTCVGDNNWMWVIANSFFIASIVLAVASFIGKVHAPFSRKLLDTAQVLSLLIYRNVFLDAEQLKMLVLFRQANLSYFINNFISNYFNGAYLSQSKTSAQYIDLSSYGQDPPSKFLENGKSANFLMNIAPIAICWLMGCFLFFLVGLSGSLLGKFPSVCGFMSSHAMNLLYILFYLTFQESALNIVLQLRDLSFTSMLNIAAFAVMIILGVVAFILIIRNILITLNKYPENGALRRQEVQLRRLEVPFVFLFEGSATSQDPSVSANSSFWMPLQLVYKAALVVLLVTIDSSLAYIITIAVFAGLFILISPEKGKLLWVLLLAVDVIPIVSSVYISTTWLFHTIMRAAYIIIVLAILIEIIFNKCLYEDPSALPTSESSKLPATAEVVDAKTGVPSKVTPLNDEKEMRGQKQIYLDVPSTAEQPNPRSITPMNRPISTSQSIGQRRPSRPSIRNAAPPPPRQYIDDRWDIQPVIKRTNPPRINEKYLDRSVNEEVYESKQRAYKDINNSQDQSIAANEDNEFLPLHDLVFPNERNYSQTLSPSKGREEKKASNLDNMRRDAGLLKNPPQKRSLKRREGYDSNSMWKFD